MPQFLIKTYEMVDDPSSDAIVSWGATNQSFIVWSPLDFARDLLPKYFKHSNFSSFIRQLNTYGFRKVDSVRWEFANDNFVRDQPDLLKNICRRKPIHSHSLQNLHGQRKAPLTESERQGLKGEIEKLKHEKEQLLMEFQRNELKWKMHEMHFHSSKDRLEKLEHKQQSVISSISQVLQKPGVASNLGSLIENMDNKLRFSRSGHFDNNTCIGDPMETSQMHFSNNASIGDPMETSQMYFSNNASIEDLMETSQMLQSDNVGSTSVFSSNMERMDLLESSMMFLENVVHDVSGNSIQSHSNIDLGASINCVDGPFISCVKLNVEVQPKSPGTSMVVEPVVPVIPDLLESSMTFLENVVHDVSGNSVRSHSNIDLGESISCIDGSSISCMQLNLEVQPKSPRINMSVEPVVPVIPDLLEPSMTFLENVVHDVSGNSIQSHSNIDLGESINCIDGSSISCMQLNLEVQPKSPRINMSVEPVVPVIPDLLEPSMTNLENVVHDVSENSVQSHSNIDLGKSISCIDGSSISCMQLNLEAQPKSPGINMSVESTIPVIPDLLEPSMTFLENGVHDISGNSVQSYSNLYLGESISCIDSSSISCMQLNLEAQPKSPGINMSVESTILDIPDLLEPSMTFLENGVHDISGNSVQSHSNLDLGESISCVDSSSISCMQLNVEVQPKSPKINMSVESVVPVIPNLVQPMEQLVGTPMAPRPNDHFWEHFLTENPGSH